MKIKNYLLTGLAVFGLGLSACSDDNNDPNGTEQGEGSITVHIQGSTSSRATTPITEESDIYNYRIYVFSWNTGVLEREVPVTDGTQMTTVIPKLSTGSTKRVVVLTNLGTKYPNVTNYNQFKDSLFDLDMQSPETIEEKGFIMNGESDAPVKLDPKAAVNEEKIKLKRAVAKVTLESITFEPAEGHDLSLLEITGVAVQRVAPEISLAPVKSSYINEEGFHYGGFASADETLKTKTYLADALNMTNLQPNQPYTLNNFFFVYPNYDNEDNCTLLTIRANYDGNELYYPIRINHAAGAEQFVHHNKHYKITVTLKKIGEGPVDPEIPPTEADLTVIVEVEDWDVVSQNENW